MGDIQHATHTRNNKGHTMTLTRFQNYIRYSTECPSDVSKVRWLAMLKVAWRRGWTMSKPKRFIAGSKHSVRRILTS